MIRKVMSKVSNVESLVSEAISVIDTPGSKSLFKSILIGTVLAKKLDKADKLVTDTDNVLLECIGILSNGCDEKVLNHYNNILQSNTEMSTKLYKYLNK